MTRTPYVAQLPRGQRNWEQKSKLRDKAWDDLIIHAGAPAFLHLSVTHAVFGKRLSGFRSRKRAMTTVCLGKRPILQSVNRRFPAFFSKFDRIRPDQIYVYLESIITSWSRARAFGIWNLFDSYTTKSSAYNMTSTNFVSTLIWSFSKMANESGFRLFPWAKPVVCVKGGSSAISSSMIILLFLSGKSFDGRELLRSKLAFILGVGLFQWQRPWSSSQGTGSINTIVTFGPKPTFLCPKFARRSYSRRSVVFVCCLPWPKTTPRRT